MAKLLTEMVQRRRLFSRVWQVIFPPYEYISKIASMKHDLCESAGFPVAQTIKNLPAMQETWVQSLRQEDPLEKGMAIHSSILVWRILWTEEPGGLHTVHGVTES